MLLVREDDNRTVDQERPKVRRRGLRRSALLTLCGLTACVMPNPEFRHNQANDTVQGSGTLEDSEEEELESEGHSPSSVEEQSDSDPFPEIPEGELEDEEEGINDDKGDDADGGETDSNESASDGEVGGTDSGAGDGGETGVDEEDGGASDGGVEGGADAGGGTDERYKSCADFDNPNLVACYPFDDISFGDEDVLTTDESGNANHLRAPSIRLIEGDPSRGTVLGVDENSEIYATDSDSLDFAQQMTLSVWVYFDQFPSKKGYRQGVLDNDEQYGLFTDDQRRINCWINGVNLASASLELSTWYHIGCTRDVEGVMSLYVDGEVAAVVKGAPEIFTDNENVMAVGDSSPDFDQGMTGRLDELSIWKIALSEGSLATISKN